MPELVSRGEIIERIQKAAGPDSYDPDCPDISDAQLQTACRIVAQCLQLGVRIPPGRMAQTPERTVVDVPWINRNLGPALATAREEFLARKAKEAEQAWDRLEGSAYPTLREDIRFFLKVQQRRLFERMRRKLGEKKS